MQVQVKFFASLSDALGCGSCEATLAPGATLPQLLAVLTRKFHSAAQALENEGVRIAVNQDLVPLTTVVNHVLQAGDEVAFLPPVTGG